MDKSKPPSTPSNKSITQRKRVRSAQPKHLVAPLKSKTLSHLIANSGAPTVTKRVSYTRPVFDAIYANDINAIENLVKVKKVKLDIVDEDNPLLPTPVLAACERRSLDIIRILLKSKPKPDINKANRRGRQPIWWVTCFIQFKDEHMKAETTHNIDIFTNNINKTNGAFKQTCENDFQLVYCIQIIVTVGLTSPCASPGDLEHNLEAPYSPPGNNH